MSDSRIASELKNIREKAAEVHDHSMLLAFLSTILSIINTILVFFTIGMNAFDIMTFGLYPVCITIFTISLIAGIFAYFVSRGENYFQSSFEKIIKKMKNDNVSFNENEFYHQIQKTNHINIFFALFMNFCADFIAISSFLNLIFYLCTHLLINSISLHIIVVFASILVAFSITLWRHKIITDKEDLTANRLELIKRINKTNKLNNNVTYIEKPTNIPNNIQYQILFLVLSIAIGILCFYLLNNLILFKNPYIFSNSFLNLLTLFEKIVSVSTLCVSMAISFICHRIFVSLYEKKPDFHLTLTLIQFVLSFLAFSLFANRMAVVVVNLLAIDVSKSFIDYLDKLVWFGGLVLSSIYGLTYNQLRSKDRIFDRDTIKLSEAVKEHETTNKPVPSESFANVNAVNDELYSSTNQPTENQVRNSCTIS